MKIHAFSIVKNESDIIKQTLTRALVWCDYIYVFDNGSTDSTWEIVLELAKTHSQIIPYKQDSCPFNDRLRGQIFNFYRDKFEEGDWCYRLDADEIAAEDPKAFLAKVPPAYQVVCAAIFIYYFTEKDLAVYRENPARYDDDVPIEQKVSHYRNSESEIRFFRYRKDLVWKDEKDCLIPSDYKDWPKGLRREAYPTLIKMKNYRYRSPEQIQKRINVRLSLVAKGKFPQEMSYQWQELVTEDSKQFEFSRWESRVVDSTKLDFEGDGSELVVRQDLMLDMRSILIGYDIVMTPQTHLRELARKVKRSCVRFGLLKRSLGS